MRRLFIGLVVAAAAALVPTWALAGNQEVAEQIAASLKDSGQLHGYKIGVKYQDGTAWLRGQVSDREQMNAALKLVFKTPGVTRVVNNLTIGSEGLAADRVQEAVTQPATSSLQQAEGALAAERLPRARDARSEAPRPIGRADRVASVVAPTAQVRMTALQEPTLAVPQDSASGSASEAVAPQPTPAPEAAVVQPAAVRSNRPLAMALTQAPPPPVPMAPSAAGAPPAPMGAPIPGAPMAPVPAGTAAAQYDHPNLPNYAWPGYAAYPNYAAVTYPKQYSPMAWPYIGPFYPYPQVPLGWRKVTLQWHDGWWNLNFDNGKTDGHFSGLFRPFKQ